MREINVKEIENKTEELFIKANTFLPKDLEKKIKECTELEKNPGAKSIFCDMCKNLNAARELSVPICQDTGLAVLFAEIGQDVHLVGGDFSEAVNRGVKKAYLDGKMRCSAVKDPLRRENTGDNTPAIIHISLVPGSNVKLTAAPKGFGSENMSRIKMFNPSATKEDIINFVTETVRLAGSNPCPPLVVGVGLGSDFEGAAILSKKALTTPVGEINPDPFYKELEDEMLESINKLNIGAQGFGGDITALAVNIKAAPTHIAGLPVAVNIGCHVTRHAEAVI